MRKSLIAFAAAATLAVGTLATTQRAEAHPVVAVWVGAGVAADMVLVPLACKTPMPDPLGLCKLPRLPSPFN
jgi:hypothetical protein